MDEKPKKVIYKRWWFWITILIIVGIMGSGSDSTSSVNTKDNESSALETVNIIDNEETIEIKQKAEAEAAQIEKDRLDKVEEERLAKVEADRLAKIEASKTVNASQEKSYIVYITRTGEKYHRSGCRYLSQSCIQTNLNDAISDGFTPCKVCRP